MNPRPAFLVDLHPITVYHLVITDRSGLGMKQSQVTTALVTRGIMQTTAWSRVLFMGSVTSQDAEDINVAVSTA